MAMCHRCHAPSPNEYLNYQPHGMIINAAPYPLIQVGEFDSQHLGLFVSLKLVEASFLLD